MSNDLKAVVLLCYYAFILFMMHNTNKTIAKCTDNIWQLFNAKDMCNLELGEMWLKIVIELNRSVLCYLQYCFVYILTHN